MRYAIVDGADVVLNVIELEPGAEFEAPQGCTLVPNRDWPVAPSVGTPTIAPSFRPQDLLAQMTTDDSAKIQGAVSANVQFWLLWQSLLAQADPIQTDSDRFLAGKGALVTVLGSDRWSTIALALNIPA